MKNFKNVVGTLVLIATISFISCDSKDDNPTFVDPPTAQEFKQIRADALESLTQYFQFNADNGNGTFVSAKGVEIRINSSCLTLNGNAVTGNVDVEFVELFDKGNILTTHKPTMGTMPNGDKAMLVTGGEFFIKATQNGSELTTTCSINLRVPANLTGSIDTEMILWDGVIDNNEDLTWNEAEDANGRGGVFAEGGKYFAFLNQFGWTNIDRFYNDTRAKTTIQIAAPTGYDYTNSAVYLSYDGEDSGLASLDTYVGGYFSEHYGQIPVGLACHVIFVTEDNGQWRYAVKAVTIVANDIITFTMNEAVVGTESDVVAAINGLP